MLGLLFLASITLSAPFFVALIGFSTSAPSLTTFIFAWAISSTLYTPRLGLSNLPFPSNPYVSSCMYFLPLGSGDFICTAKGVSENFTDGFLPIDKLSGLTNQYPPAPVFSVVFGEALKFSL